MVTIGVLFTINNLVWEEYMERVKFYSKLDLGCGFNLEKAYKVLNNYDENKIDYDINDILEFYNIFFLL